MIERVTFRAGELALDGLLERPEGAAAWGGAVFCHPHPLYGGNMHNNVVWKVTPALIQSGLAVLRFNFRGVGRSQGTYADGEGEREDLRAALAFLGGAEDMAGRPLVVLGYSFGAAVAARAVAKDSTGVAALVCIALPVGLAGFGDFAELQHVTLPKLFLAGTEDEFCPPPKLRELVRSLPEPRSLVVLDGADHFFHGREPELASHIAGFLNAQHPAT